MTQAHALRAIELAIRAQNTARGWQWTAAEATKGGSPWLKTDSRRGAGGRAIAAIHLDAYLAFQDLAK